MSDREIMRALQAAESRLSAVGIDVSRSSRLGQYKASLEARLSSASWKSSRSVFELVSLSVHQLNRLVTAINVVGREPAVPGWRGKAELALTGQALPDSLNQKSLARDTEFELRLAAWLKSAGLVPRFEEPDIVVTDVDGIWSVSAKRPGSLRRLGKAVRKAAKQIDMAGHDGVLALDISKLIKAEGQLSYYQSRGSHLAGVEHVANKFLDDNISAIRAHAKSDNRVRPDCRARGSVRVPRGAARGSEPPHRDGEPRSP